MKRSKHTEEQIIAILKEQEGGAKTAEVCHKQQRYLVQQEGQVRGSQHFGDQASACANGRLLREPMLAGGQVDAIAAFSFNAINLKERGVPADDIVVMLMADHGVDLYGNAIVVNTKFAAEKPDIVRKFLSAFAKGFKDTIRDPATAVGSVVKRNDVAKKEVELERLRMLLKDNVDTDHTRANGVGNVDVGRLEKSIDQIAITYEFKNSKPKGSDIFDPSFLPPANELKIN